MLHWPCAAGSAVWFFPRRAVWLSPISFLPLQKGTGALPESIINNIGWFYCLPAKPPYTVRSCSDPGRSRQVSVSDSSAWLSYCLQTAPSPSPTHDKRTRPDRLQRCRAFFSFLSLSDPCALRLTRPSPGRPRLKKQF
ncbi:hypothetical protein VTN02DRAFT_6317 [Thermoascus thermophilus]